MSETKQSRRWWVVVILALILLAAFVLRTWHIDWADGQLPHPDERSTVAFYAPSVRWPAEGISPLDKRQSPLNPLWDVNRNERRSYTYGHFPLYLLALTAAAFHELAPVAEKLGAPADLVHTLLTANGVPGFAIVGRLLMAVADTFTVLLVFLLAQRTYRRRGPWVALLAAAFSAFTVLQIQLSHFFAVDPISTTFTALALYGSVRLVQDRGHRWALVTGVGAGLAIASKFSALPILAAPVVAGFLIWWRGRRAGDDVVRLSLARIAGLAALALVSALVVFAVTSPFALLDWENFSRAVIVEQGGMVRGDGDFPWTRQYRGTGPYLYFIQQQVKWGIGWPLGLLSFASLGWVLVKLLLGKARDGELVVLSWVVLYFGFTGMFLAKFMRYMIPVTPFLMIFAAGLIAAIWDLAEGREGKQGVLGKEGKEGKEEELEELGELREVELAERWAEGYDAAGTVVAEQDEESSPAPIPQPPLPTPHSPPPTRRSPHPIFHWIAGGIAAVALLGAIFWSLAFVNGVYNDTHPWIKASHWMYANIPDGSTIAWEQWDDPLPYDLPGENRGRFNIIDWGPFEEDTAEKFQRLKDTLRQADYISLASNRIYGAVDNLPQRYPMTNRYYQLLFNGELGYELALEQVNSPNLLGISISDIKADESFTLYDHPRVLVFRKVRDLTDAEWDALLGGSWEDAQPWDVGDPPIMQRLWAALGLSDAPPPPPAEDQPGEGKSLLLDRPLDELPVLDDFRWNAAASESTPIAVIVWWLALFVVGLAAWPLTFGLFCGWRDRGYLLSRSLGLLLVGYLVWIAASLQVGENSLPFIRLALGLVALASLVVWWRQRAALGNFVQTRWRLLLLNEGIFLAAFLLFVAFRIANPDIWQPWQGGEKFMEFAFLNGILRSAHFPPLDPYFAGGTINYYYYGQYLVTLLIKLTGIASSVAFNLAIPTIFALTVGNVFSLGYNLAGDLSDRVAQPDPATEDEDVPRRRWTPALTGGLLAAFFVALLGNVDGGGQVVRRLAEQSASAFQSNLPGLQTGVKAVSGLARVIGPGEISGYNYWDPSRVIPFTINEFPYWSFIFADLHPHMIGIPFTVLFLGLAYTLLRRGRQDVVVAAKSVVAAIPAPAAEVEGENQPRPVPTSSTGRGLTGLIALLTGNGLYPAMALVLGALAVINTWDLPTYFGLAVLVWLVREWRLGRLASNPVRALLRTAIFAAALLVLALLLYAPFFASYSPIAASGVGINPLKGEAGPWLRMWGFLFFLAATFVLVELRRRLAAWASDPDEPAPGSHGQDARDPALLRWLRLALNNVPRLARLVELTPDLSARGLGALAVTVLVAALLWLAGWQVPALLVLPLAGALALLWRRSGSDGRAFVVVLVFTSFLVLVGVEFIYLKDHLQGGEWRRMNTLFKFYIQVWVMLALAGAVTLPGLWRFVHARWRPVWRVLWTIALGYLLVLSLAFLLFGTQARLNDRFPEANGRPAVGTLDGMAYMQAGRYYWHPDAAQASSTEIELRYDYEALNWLLDNVTGTPLVAEAPIGYYREGGLRVASFTGFPTFIGFHQEGEQRYGDQTGPRRGLAEEFWRTPDPARAGQIIDELGVDYIYAGRLEQITTPAEGIAKFDKMVQQGALEIVYQNDQVTIYRVAS